MTLTGRSDICCRRFETIPSVPGVDSPEDRSRVTRESLAELYLRIALHQLGQPLPPLDQRSGANISPIEVENVEGDETKAARFGSDRPADSIEVRRALLIADDHLARR